MAIEIRELLIKVKVGDSGTAPPSTLQLEELKHYLMKECRKEVRKELNRSKER